MKFIEIYYWLMNIPYYKISIVKDMEVLKTIIQPVMSSKKIKGSDKGFIDIKGKRAWFKMPEACFRDGKKFLGFADIDNAFQLVEETKINIVSDGLIVKEQTISRLKNSVIEITDKRQGKMKTFVTAFPTGLLYEVLSGHFITMALSNPKEKTDWTIVIIAVAAMVVGVLIFYLMNHH